MAIPEKYRIWVVDTKDEDYDLVKRSFGSADWVELRHVRAAEQFLAEMDRNIFEPDEMPHIVMLDYFMETMFGHDILPLFHEKLMAAADVRPYVIAFSSMEKANQTMLDAGANWEILKDKTQDKLPAITEYMGSRDAIAKLLGHTEG